MVCGSAQGEGNGEKTEPKREEKVVRNDKNERKERSNKNRSRKQSEGKKKELYTEK